MPALPASPPYTTLDVQNQMISLLNADAQIQAILLKADDTFNPVVSADLEPGSISEDEKTRLVFELAADDEDDATMGGTQGGTAFVPMLFAAMLYTFDGPNRTILGKQTNVKNTGIVRAALMRYRQVSAVLPGQTTATQLWWKSQFIRKGGYASIYYTPAGVCRLSVTMIELTSRIPYT